MAESPGWLLWVYGDHDEKGKRGKIPYGIEGNWGLTAAKTGTLHQALAIWRQAPDAFKGVGYRPTLDCPFIGLDFDDLTLPGPLEIWNYVRQHSYCEFSPSGQGGRGIIGVGRDVKLRLKDHGSRWAPGLEVYACKSWFTVTGRVIADKAIRRNDALMLRLANEHGIQPYMPREHVATGDVAFDDVAAAVRAIPNPDLDYDRWLNVILAINYVTGGSDAGRVLAQGWSAKSRKHDPEHFQKRWEKMRPDGTLGMKFLLERVYTPPTQQSVIQWRTSIIDAICYARPKTNRATLEHYSDAVLSDIYRTIPRAQLPKRAGFIMS